MADNPIVAAIAALGPLKPHEFETALGALCGSAVVGGCCVMGVARRLLLAAASQTAIAATGEGSDGLASRWNELAVADLAPFLNMLMQMLDKNEGVAGNA